MGEILLGLVFGVMGGMGVGGGAVLIPALVLFLGLGQQEAQGVSLVAFLPASLAAAFIHIKHKRINWKAVAWMAVPGTALAVAGAVLSNAMQVDALRTAFGTFLLLLGLWQGVGMFKKWKGGAYRKMDKGKRGTQIPPAADAHLTLVNADHPMEGPPGRLSSDWGEGRFRLDKEVELEVDALRAAKRMLNEAGQSRLCFVVVSGYRAADYQAQLFEKKVEDIQASRRLSRREAEAEAAKVVARPGCSEHNTGLALDVTAQSLADREDVLSEDFAYTPEGRWLAQHAHRFGFILRYPADKQHITGIQSEPWHIRYVGEEHAAQMREEGLCLEEYLAEREGRLRRD